MLELLDALGVFTFIHCVLTNLGNVFRWKELNHQEACYCVIAWLAVLTSGPVIVWVIVQAFLATRT